jgi:hypothetical protein
MVDIVMNVEDGRGKLSPHVQTKCGSATSFSKLNSRQYLSCRGEVVARGELAGLGPMKQAVWAVVRSRALSDGGKRAGPE